VFNGTLNKKPPAMRVVLHTYSNIRRLSVIIEVVQAEIINTKGEMPYG